MIRIGLDGVLDGGANGAGPALGVGAALAVVRGDGAFEQLAEAQALGGAAGVAAGEGVYGGVGALDEAVLVDDDEGDGGVVGKGGEPEAAIVELRLERNRQTGRRKTHARHLPGSMRAGGQLHH